MPNRNLTLSDATRVLVTGGTTGIGRATAALLRERGARVLVCARSEGELPAGVSFYRCDLAEPSERQALADHVLREFDGLDVLVNNAAIQVPLSLAEGPAWSLLERELAVNFAAPLHLTSLLLAALKRGARPAAIVNLTSALAFAPKPSAPLYCATKAALASLTTTLRAQLAGTSVRVHEIIPPLADTKMTAGRGGKKASPEQVARALVTALTRGDERVLVGPTRLLWLLHRLSPSLALRLMAKQ